jgi:hypothetical protein
MPIANVLKKFLLYIAKLSHEERVSFACMFIGLRPNGDFSWAEAYRNSNPGDALENAFEILIADFLFSLEGENVSDQ